MPVYYADEPAQHKLDAYAYVSASVQRIERGSDPFAMESPGQARAVERQDDADAPMMPAEEAAEVARMALLAEWFAVQACREARQLANRATATAD